MNSYRPLASVAKMVGARPMPEFVGIADPHEQNIMRPGKGEYPQWLLKNGDQLARRCLANWVGPRFLRWCLRNSPESLLGCWVCSRRSSTTQQECPTEINPSHIHDECRFFRAARSAKISCRFLQNAATIPPTPQGLASLCVAWPSDLPPCFFPAHSP